jgi:hypothetical protein
MPTVPPQAELLRASTFPNIRFKAATAYEAMSAIKDADLVEDDLSIELAAYENSRGETPFSQGTDITEAQLRAVCEDLPENADAFHLIVMRYVYAHATIDEGGGQV